MTPDPAADATPPADPFVQIIGFSNLPGAPRPNDALIDWLCDRGIDWMPFASDEIRGGLTCGRHPSGRWWGWFHLEVRESALLRLGLHPDQPTSRPAEPRAPRRWYTMAAARRRPRKGRRYP